MVEYFDHIDEDDNVIGRITRAEAHDKFLMHRAVHILIENDEGKILLHQIARHKRAYQLHISFSAAGHVEAGSDYEATAKKELYEELGIETELRLIAKYRQIIPEIENEICALYTGQHNGPYTNWEVEAENIYLFSREELDRLILAQPHIFTPTFKSSYRIFRELEIKQAA